MVVRRLGSSGRASTSPRVISVYWVELLEAAVPWQVHGPPPWFGWAASFCNRKLWTEYSVRVCFTEASSLRTTVSIESVQGSPVGLVYSKLLARLISRIVWQELIRNLASEHIYPSV